MGKDFLSSYLILQCCCQALLILLLGKDFFVDVGQIESNDNDMSIWHEKKCGDQTG